MLLEDDGLHPVTLGSFRRLHVVHKSGEKTGGGMDMHIHRAL